MRRPVRPEPAPTGPGARLLATAAAGLIALAALAVQTAPVAGWPAAWKPDLAWVVLAYFALRRPDALPLAVLAGVLIARDALTGGPPGAGAFAALLTLEALRAHALRRAGAPSALGDWALLAAAFAAALALQWLLLALTFAAAPPPAALVPGWVATVASAPLVAGLLRYGLRLGVRAPEVRP